jgi:hypothetical protein
LLVLGLLFLLLPPAAQSFEPGGSRYGLELIAEGLLFLVIGFTMTMRWLVVGGVFALSGVAIRWFFSGGGPGAEVPYWLTLGIIGTGLLMVGLLLLLERERWDRARGRIGRWWIEAPARSHGNDSGA